MTFWYYQATKVGDGVSAKEGVNMFWTLNNYSSIPFLLFAFHCSSDC